MAVQVKNNNNNNNRISIPPLVVTSEYFPDESLLLPTKHSNSVTLKNWTAVAHSQQPAQHFGQLDNISVKLVA